MPSTSSSSAGAAAARKAAEDLRKRQGRARARRNTLFAALGAVALVAVFAVVAIFIAKDSGAVKTPKFADESGGILVGASGVAGATAPSGAVRVDLYEDPLCPYCKLFIQYGGAELGSLIDSGDVALYYHPISFLDASSAGTRYSTRAANAMATTAEYDPTHFFTFVEALFANQTAENQPGLTDAQIAQIASGAGVTSAAIDKFTAEEFTPWVTSATDQSSVDGVRSTPTIRVAGVDFVEWTTGGNLTLAVQYAKAHGTQGLADYIATLAPPTASPSPSPSAS